MKKFFFVFTLNLYVLSLSAQTDTLWRYSLNTGINFNQTAFNDEWSGGGISSISINSFFNGVGLYEKDKITWRNEGELLYGIINQSEEQARKTVDRIFFDSKFGYQLSSDWNLFASVNILTQFDEGFRFSDDTKEKISDFMAPAFITSSYGFEWTPSDDFWLRAGPFSPRLTIVTADDLAVEENYGVEEGETVRFEVLAFQLVAELDKNIRDNLNIRSRYALFSNYEEFEFDKIDHRLDINISAQVTEIINVNLGAIFIYDFDQIEALQISEALSVGINYKISTIP